MNMLKPLGLDAQWQRWQTRFKAFKPREQVLVAAAGVAILLMLCDQLLWTPLARASAQQRNLIDSTQQQLDELKAARIAVDSKLAEDPDAELRRELDAVNERLAKKNAQLTALTVDLIPPAAMADALRAVLSERGRLQLIALRNEDAVPAFAPAGAATREPDAATERVAIYRHALTLEFKGRYFDVVEYLQALEKMQWRFYWEALDYRVEQYPEAIITLRVYTLSNRESWIGA